jgi:pSer/pThr/pTyr-binding forkhead associated (FHA) protein
MGGSAAETPASSDRPPGPGVPPAPGRPEAPGLRASDAERDQVVDRLRDEFVAGRLSHDTFLHRVNVVLESRRQADLPPVVADLPVPPPPRSVGAWLRGAWARVAGQGPAAPGGAGEAPAYAAPAARRRALTTSLSAARDRSRPHSLSFPRGAGSRFSIGRDGNCDLALADMTVSRRHAQLERTDQGWLLSDLSSTNGTRLNGWRVRGQVPVRPGDLVSFGDLMVIFRPADDPLTQP